MSPSGERYEELQALKRISASKLPAFHWMIEFPEVFYAGRRDPLAGDGAEKPGFIDAFVGNPPFMGRKQDLRRLGTPIRIGSPRSTRAHGTPTL